MSDIFLKKEEFENIFKNHLKIETYSKRIDSLFSTRFRKRINFKPYYQRNYVWDEHKASYFIESILLGTEIPPLIFFKSGNSIEVIDGRQRYETIKRFLDDELILTKMGLFSLKLFAKHSFNDFSTKHEKIAESFLDSKLRIIEFEVVNKKNFDTHLEDKIKKEIFSRYNSGITPLKKPEIDNAVYDDEPISTFFKSELKHNEKLIDLFGNLFFKQRLKATKVVSIDKIMQVIRRNLVLHKFPIKYYAGGTGKTELIKKFFDYISDNTNNHEELFHKFIDKVTIINEIKNLSLLENKNSFNRLVSECLLWALFILENEDIDYKLLLRTSTKKKLIKFISKHQNDYSEDSSHYYENVMKRYNTTSDFFRDEFKIDFDVYTLGSKNTKDQLSTIRKRKLKSTIVEDFNTIKITKPDPSRSSIDDFINLMQRNRFLLRPSYQRSEVINLSKASSIIESILLDIMIPAIFVYKRKDDVLEVIDGQQRLLTILGFLGEKYIDENKTKQKSNKHNFKLRNLRILKELKSKSFKELDQTMQDKIWDFELFVVEIEESLNPEFDPVDLFIRLNDKPYPIRENSFEMWNSWVDKEVISEIKDYAKANVSWFYIKSKKQLKFKDRMENEELYTSLAYLEFKKTHSKEKINYLEIYQKGNRINSRIRDKKDVTNVLSSVTENYKTKEDFLSNLTDTQDFINKLEIILSVDIPTKLSKNEFLINELDVIFKAGKKNRSYRRRLQDFFIIWKIIHEIELSTIKRHRVEIKESIITIFKKMKNIEEKELDNNLGYKNFMKLIAKHNKRFNIE